MKAINPNEIKDNFIELIDITIMIIRLSSTRTARCESTL